MPVRIEFYGIPRRRAGTATAQVEASTLGEAVTSLIQRFAGLDDVCDASGSLRPGYLASVNGTTFTTDPLTPLRDGDSVLILSADAGG